MLRKSKILSLLVAVMMLTLSVSTIGYADTTATVTVKRAVDRTVLEEGGVLPYDDNISLELPDGVSITDDNVKLEKVEQDGIYNFKTKHGDAAITRYFKIMDGSSAASVAGKKLVVEARVRSHSKENATFYVSMYTGSSFETIDLTDGNIGYATIGLNGHNTVGKSRVSIIDARNREKYLDYTLDSWADIKWTIDTSVGTHGMTLNTNEGDALSSSIVGVNNLSAVVGNASVIGFSSYCGSDALEYDLSYIKVYTEDAPNKLLVNQTFEGVESENELQNYVIKKADSINVALSKVNVTSAVEYESTTTEGTYTIKPTENLESGASYRLTISGINDVEDKVVNFVAKELYEAEGMASVSGITDKNEKTILGRNYITSSAFPLSVAFSSDTNMSTVSKETIKLENVEKDGVYRVNNIKGNANLTKFFKLTDLGKAADLTGKTLVVEGRIRMSAVSGMLMMQVISDSSYENITAESATHGKMLFTGDIGTTPQEASIEVYTTLYRGGRSHSYLSGEWVDFVWELDVPNKKQQMKLTTETTTFDTGVINAINEEGSPETYGKAVALGLYSYSSNTMDADFSYIKAYAKDDPTKLYINQDFEGVTSESQLADFGTLSNNDITTSFVTVERISPLEYDVDKIGNNATVTIPSPKYLATYRLSVTTDVKSNGGNDLINPQSILFTTVTSNSLYVKDSGIKQNGSSVTSPIATTGSVTGWAEIANYTDEPTDVQLITAVYKGDIFMIADVNEITVPGNSSQVYTSKDAVAAAEGDTVRVFVWENDYRPVYPAK